MPRRLVKIGEAVVTGVELSSKNGMVQPEVGVVLRVSSGNVGGLLLNQPALLAKSLSVNDLHKEAPGVLEPGPPAI